MSKFLIFNSNKLDFCVVKERLCNRFLSQILIYWNYKNCVHKGGSSTLMTIEHFDRVYMLITFLSLFSLADHSLKIAKYPL